MGTKLKIASLILSGLLVAFSLTACSSPPSSGGPDSQKSTIAPGSPPGGQLPGGSTPDLSGNGPSGFPDKLPSGGPPSGFPGNLPGANSQPTQPGLTLPDQSNIVTGSGTVGVSTYANLFFGTGGQVASINVKEGNQVTKGTVLAQLDTSSLELLVAQAQANIDQTQVNIALNEQNLLQHQQNLALAQQNLNSQQDVQDIQTKIDNANIQLEQAKVMLKEATSVSDSEGMTYWRNQINYYSDEVSGKIVALQKEMRDLLEDPAHAGASLVTNATSATQIQSYALAVKIVQQQIVTDQANLAAAKSNLILAQKTLNYTQHQLDQAVIKAPFEGTVARIFPQVGDTISAPAQAQNPVIYLIDQSTLQFEIYVNELDIPQVKTGQKASVSINAFPDTKIDGVVTAISPASTTLGGVIYYDVTISFSAPSDIDARIGMNGSASLSIK
jgi:HlyD family secretion protein